MVADTARSLVGGLDSWSVHTWFVSEERPVRGSCSSGSVLCGFVDL